MAGDLRVMQPAASFFQLLELQVASEVSELKAAQVSGCCADDVVNPTIIRPYLRWVNTSYF